MRFRQHEEAAQASTRGLLGLFALVLAGLVVAVNAVLVLAYRLSFPFLDGYPALFFETNTALVLLFVLGGCWFETLRLREGGAHVARLAGARPAQAGGAAAGERLERRLQHVVQEMALASRYRAPAAWVMPREQAINAFAAGWSEDDAVIAVTQGALERLTREELQGVVAHEFSHLVHGDTRLNMRLIGMVWGLQMLFHFGRELSEPDEQGRRPASTLFGLALMAVGALGWAAGRLLQAAVSREREFLADASAVKYTRQVAGIGGALRKIAEQARTRSNGLRQPQAQSLAHLYLAVPGRWTRWWSSHPDLGERLRRLYGRVMDPLPAPALPAPAPAEDEDAPIAGFEAAAAGPLAPLGARTAGPIAPWEAPTAGATARLDAAAAGAGALGASSSGSTGLDVPSDAWRAELAEGGAPAQPGTPEAERHDPLQSGQRHAAALRQREALERIDRWHGAGERRAGLLALLAGVDDDEAAWTAWRDAVQGLAVAEAVRTELQTLDGVARLGAMELLARRSAAAPRDEQAALRRGARAIARSAPARLHRLALTRLLHFAGERSLDAQRARDPLVQRWPEAIAATVALGPALGLAAPAAERWRDEALQQLQSALLEDEPRAAGAAGAAVAARAGGPGPAAARPARGLAPPVGSWTGPGTAPSRMVDTGWLGVRRGAPPPALRSALPGSSGQLAAMRTLRSALRLRRVAPLQRPLLARAWVQAMPPALLRDERVADGLQLACLLLDTPLPPALAARQALRARSAPPQARSL